MSKHCYVLYDSCDEETQLPRFVADTISELAVLADVTPNAIKKGLQRKSKRYRRIDFEANESAAA